MNCKQCGFKEELTGPLINGYCTPCIQGEEDANRMEVVSQEEDAMRWLDRDLSVEPTWWSPKLTKFGGPIMPGLTLVCARPCNGKTTLFANQIIHAANDPQQKVLCFPLETSPGKFRITLAAIEEGLNPGLVRRREWESLPPGAKQRVVKKMGEQSARWGDRLRMVGDDRITQRELLTHLKDAHDQKYTLVALDHLHEVAWTDDPDKLTAEMTEGMHKIRVLLREYESTEYPLRLLAACQLKRPTGYDALEEYMVPPLSAIKQSGAAEEVAAYVYMLYRALKDGVTEGDMKLVRGGQMPVSEVADIGTTKLNCAKHRDDGGLKGQEIKMYIQEDRLLDEKPTHGWLPVAPANTHGEVI